MDAVILCNGEFPKRSYPLYLLKNADLLICCDSRNNVGRLAKMGLEPAVIVGDMDSTPREVQEQYADRLVRLTGQDDNDLAKAFKLLRECWPQATTIHILGAGGRSEAHTIGNLGWLMEWERRGLNGRGLAESGIYVEMVSDHTTAFAISQSADLHVGEGRKISFFSIDPTLRINSTGLVWPLDGVELGKWWGATLNRADSDVVTLQFSHPSPLLVILD